MVKPLKSVLSLFSSVAIVAGHCALAAADDLIPMASEGEVGVKEIGLDTLAMRPAFEYLLTSGTLSSEEGLYKTFIIDGVKMTLIDPRVSYVLRPNDGVTYKDESEIKENIRFWAEFTPSEQDKIVEDSYSALVDALVELPDADWSTFLLIRAIIDGASSVLAQGKKCEGNLKVNYTGSGTVHSSECL